MFQYPNDNTIWFKPGTSGVMGGEIGIFIAQPKYCDEVVTRRIQLVALN